MQSDALLAVRCQLGEVDALDELVRRFHPALSTYAHRVTGSDDAAADVVQEIWLRVVRGLPRLREPERLRAWLFGIAHRALMDRFRQHYANREVTGVDHSRLIASIRTLEGRLRERPWTKVVPNGQAVSVGEWDLRRWVAESLDTTREIAALAPGSPA